MFMLLIRASVRHLKEKASALNSYLRSKIYGATRSSTPTIVL